MAVSTPILPVLDMAEARAFYERLGFEVQEYDEFYGFVLCEGHEIAHLQVREELETTDSLSTIYLNVTDANAWHRRVSDAGATPGAIEDREWRMREFSVTDPFGNVIRIGSNL